MIAYLVLALTTILCGLGILRVCGVKIDFGRLIYLAPLLTLSMWTFFLNWGILLGYRVQDIWIIGWALTGILGVLGLWSLVKSAPKLELGYVAVVFLMPVAILFPYFWNGIFTYMGSPALDGWSGAAFAAYVWEYPNGTEGGLAPLYQYSAHLANVRFTACLMSAFLSPLLGFPGDPRAAMGILLALTLFVYSSVCVFFIIPKELDKNLKLAYLVGSTFSVWILNLVRANNFDNCLAICFLPALAGIQAHLKPDDRRSAVLLGTLCAASAYVYPEMAPIVFFGALLVLAQCIFLEGYRPRDWLRFVVMTFAVFGMLTLPYVKKLFFFFINQLASGMSSTLSRPGQGMFPELLRLKMLLPNMLGLLLPGSFHASITAVALLNFIGLIILLLSLIGFYRLSRQRDWSIVGIVVTLWMGGLYMLVIQHYDYGAYKMFNMCWWASVFLIISGAAALLSKWGTRNLQAVLVGLLLLFCVNTVVAITRFDNAVSPKRVDYYEQVKHIKNVTRGESVRVHVDDVKSNSWAVYFLKDTPILLTLFRGYMAQSHVMPLMDRAKKPPLEDVAYLLTDLDVKWPSSAANPVWAGGPYKLWDLRPVRSKYQFHTIANPNGLEKVDGRDFFWMGGASTLVDIWAGSKGKLIIRADMVARSFSEMYRSQEQEFPRESREADYEKRIMAAYPIHPELFDRLYNDWSTLEKFQRTRGVLRLMASVINSLWESKENSLLIMPANVPIDDKRVQFELTRYMEDHWVPVIEKDVDGQRSLPLELDRENPGLGRYSTCRRVARTIYMGSAPLQKAANRGIDDRMVKLGCVQPGEIVATFGDALRRLSDRATYLYVSDRRYWYSTQPTVNRLADDRAHQLHEEDVLEEIRQRLRGQARNAGNFSRVHVCASSGDIMDEQEARLVILGPDYPNTSQDIHSPARREALAILESRGPQPRSYRNTLVFLAPDGNRLLDLLEATKLYLAWKSIWDERETLNLDPFQSNQAETKLNIAGSTVEVRIPETYAWLLVPGQPDPKGSVEWREIRQQCQDPLAVRASKKLKNEELLMIQLGGVRLAHELNKIPLWRGDHVGMKQLALDFASYLYLPRLRDENVLVSAVKDGLSLLTWESETFAYADAWDDKAQKYKGLVAGRIWNGAVDSHSVLVRPEAARRQMDVAARESSAGGNIHDKGGSSTTNGPAGFIPTPTQASVKPSAPVLRRFHGSVKLDPLRMGRDAGKIAEEVVQHLKGLVNSNVEVTLEIKAEIPDGASDTTVRNVMENCRALRFDSHDFEED